LTFKERRGAIEKLSYPAQLAFAARSGERALAETHLLRPDLVAAYPALQKGVDLIWRHAVHQDVDFKRDVESVHNAASELIPESVDAVVPDQALRFASQAISLGLLMIGWPQKSAKYAASVGGAVINLVGSVYKDIDEVQDKERQWQDRAVEFLLANGDKPITRSMFDELPEYERGPISESYKTGYQG
jgi:hypothetical protein